MFWISSCFHLSGIVPGTLQADFLRTEKDEANRVGRRDILNPFGDLQQHTDAGGVIVRACTNRGRIIMGADNDLLRGKAFLYSYHIGGMHDPIFSGGSKWLGLGNISESFERINDVLGGLRFCFRACGAWSNLVGNGYHM